MLIMTLWHMVSTYIFFPKQHQGITWTYFDISFMRAWTTSMSNHIENDVASHLLNEFENFTYREKNLPFNNIISK